MRRTQRALGLLALLLVTAPAARAAAPAAAGTYRITAASLRPHLRQRYGVPALWRFRPGDAPGAASPTLDDSGWEAIRSTFADRLPRSGAPAVGWFRLWVTVDPELRGRLLALHLTGSGALELYVDGKRRFAVGDVAATAAGRASTPVVLLFDRPHPISFTGAGPHLIAVRFASQDVARVRRLGFWGGFALSVNALEQGGRHWEHFSRYIYTLNFGFIGATGALALLHLLLFGFYRARRENLYYGLAAAGAVGISLGTMFFSQAATVPQLIVGLGIFGASIAVTCACLVRHAYEIFLPRVPRYFTALAALAAILALAAWTLPRSLIYGFAGICFVELLRVLVLGLVRRVDGAWIIAVGGAFVVVSAALTMLADLGLLWAPNSLYLYGFLGLMVSLSIHLARGFARDNHALEAELQRNRELSEQALEQQRRAHEERQAALAELLAGVAHEINSPVGVLTSMAETAARSGEKIATELQNARSLEQARSAPRLQKSLQTLEASRVATAEAGRRIGDLVRSLTLFTGLDKAQLRPADLHEAIESALDLLAPRMADRVAVVRDFGELPRILCYASELSQAFAHLIKNACEAVKERGSLTIRTSRVTRDGAEHARVEFADDGVGMTDEQQQQLFDFRISRDGGQRARMGMGLKLCRVVLDKHGGTIRSARNPGRGMTFTVELPVDGRVLHDASR